MARVGSGYCTTDYVARGAAYKAQMGQLFRQRACATATATDSSDQENPWEHRACSQCGERHLALKADAAPLCFDCSPNPYKEKGIRMSVDAAGDDSTVPARIAEGTQGFNMALPPVEGEIIGKDAYGQTRRKLRPVAHNEIASNRQLKEKAKRAGLTQPEPAKRAVGGR
jgi:hypothetical protein